MCGLATSIKLGAGTMNKMLINYWQFLAAIIIVCCIAIYGSGRNTLGNSPKPELSSKKAEKNVAQKNHTLVKPGAAVQLKNSDSLYAAKPGKYEYQLQLTSPVQKGRMTVAVSPSDYGVEILAGHYFEFALDETGEYSLPLALDLKTKGRFYIQLLISISGEEQPEPVSRAISVVLQVGEPTIKMHKATMQSSASGSEGIISLPAQETISPR